MMKRIFCPISTHKVNVNSVRITGLLVYSLLSIFIVFQQPVALFILVVDFLIRSFSASPHSPLSSIAENINQRIPVKPILVGKASKVFASRIGLLFAVAALSLFYFSPDASRIVASVLLFFVLLETGFNICFGCILYSLINKPKKQ